MRTSRSTDGPALLPYGEGEVIAEKYKLWGKLGAGGMGSLWVARNVLLDAPVALKLIRADVATDELEQRFLTEARTLAKLRHPNIVRVFDYGRTQRDEPFIVMELLQGETLGGLLDRSARLAAGRTVQLLLPIVGALGVAHQKGIVHRDIKPENIFLSDDDGRVNPKLLDFGIAKSTSGLEQRKLTQSGSLMGSPEYLSPEQARGSDDVDRRTDIWSLCVVIYECLTGRIPFEGKNLPSLLRAIIEDEPVPLNDLGAGDPALWRILRKGLAKSPDQRYQEARDLGVALARWLVSHDIAEDACGQSLRSTWLDGEDALASLESDDSHEVTPVMTTRPNPRETGSRYQKIALALLTLALISVTVWFAFRLETTPAVAASPPVPPPPARIVVVSAKPPPPIELAPPAAPSAAPPVASPPVTTRRAIPPPRSVSSARPAAKPPENPKAYSADLGF